VEFVKKALSFLSPIPIFIIAGNHDYICPGSPYTERGYFSENVHIFPTFDYSFEIPEKNAVIYGKSYNSTVSEASFTNIVPNNEKINIICLHEDFNASDEYKQIDRELLSSLPFNYAAFGHIHKGEIFNAGNVKCAYSGILEGTGFDDDGQTGIILAEITENETKLTPVSFSQRRYHNISYNVNGEDTQKILEELSDLLCGEDLYKITLTGETSDEIDTVFLTSKLKENCFYIDILDETTPVYDFDAIEKEESLRGEFLRELRKLTSSEEDFILCGKAGLDALMGKIPSLEVDV